jgi:hypothetical protein
MAEASASLPTEPVSGGISGQRRVLLFGQQDQGEGRAAALEGGTGPSVVRSTGLAGSDRTTSASSRHRYIGNVSKIRTVVVDGQPEVGRGLAHDRRGELRALGLGDQVLEDDLGQLDIDRLPVQAGEGGHQDQRALALACDDRGLVRVNEILAKSESIAPMPSSRYCGLEAKGRRPGCKRLSDTRGGQELWRTADRRLLLPQRGRLLLRTAHRCKASSDASLTALILR